MNSAYGATYCWCKRGVLRRTVKTIIKSICYGDSLNPGSKREGLSRGAVLPQFLQTNFRLLNGWNVARFYSPQNKRRLVRSFEPLRSLLKGCDMIGLVHIRL